MQKALTQMNLQLANVISDLSGVTGQAIVRAIVAGERNPQKLADLSHPRIEASREMRSLRESDMLLRCLLFLVCLISAHLSLSQESAKANPRVPTTKPPVVVSKKFIVYGMGDVHSPMGVGGPTTVLKILAMAEGLNPTASLHKAKIIRKGENGRIEVPIDLEEILVGKAPDVTLQAGDILFVPRSPSKSARKPPYENFYDVPPSDPLHRPNPIYIR